MRIWIETILFSGALVAIGGAYGWALGSAPDRPGSDPAAALVARQAEEIRRLERELLGVKLALDRLRRQAAGQEQAEEKELLLPPQKLPVPGRADR